MYRANAAARTVKEFRLEGWKASEPQGNCGFVDHRERKARPYSEFKATKQDIKRLL